LLIHLAIVLYCTWIWMPSSCRLSAASTQHWSEENRPRSDISFPLRNLPVRAFDSRAQGFSTSPKDTKLALGRGAPPQLLITKPPPRLHRPVESRRQPVGVTLE
ncbi:unnamed protein product, partial [Ascophyllum nodosum]